MLGWKAAAACRHAGRICFVKPPQRASSNGHLLSHSTLLQVGCN